MTDICQGDHVSDGPSFGEGPAANRSRVEGSPCSSAALGRPILDWNALLERFGGDLDLIREVVEVFEPDFRLHLSQLREAIRTRQPATVERLAHSLRGSVGNFEASTGAALLLELEQAAAAGDLTHSRTLVDTVERSIESVLAELKQRMA